MPTLPLGPDELLTTTRSVRKRLDLTRPVGREVVLECVAIAQQAPSASFEQGWHFLVVTDPPVRAALADLYRRAAASYFAPGESSRGRPTWLLDSAGYLAEHLHDVQVHVIPCVTGRTDGLAAEVQASRWGSILPAVWSFMLAARARGLGTTLTGFHLRYDREAADLLGLPYAEVMQAGLIPLAYTLGTAFKPGRRGPLDQIVHWDRW